MRREALRDARHVAKALLGTGQALHSAFAESLLAGALRVEGDLEACTKQLRRAIAALDAVDMTLFAMPLRRRDR